MSVAGSPERDDESINERIEQDQSTGSTLQPVRPQANIRNRLNPHSIRAEG